MGFTKGERSVVNVDVSPAVNDRLDNVDSRLLENSKKIAPLVIKPMFVEIMATMGRYGTGTPSGLTNYAEGNYVCSISGNAGDSFVTVTSGTIADGGGVWACVIQDDNLEITVNKVTGINGSTFQLLSPLEKTITNGKIGNLHDAANGQHYSELGYYALAQFIYNANPKYTERNKNIRIFKGSDVTGFWKLTTSWSKYNNVTNVTNANNTLALLGSPHLVLNLASATHKAEFETTAAYKGYVELFASSSNNSTLEYTVNGEVQQTVTITPLVKRITLDFNENDTIKVKISDPTSSGTNINSLKIGNTTLYINETKVNSLFGKNDKIAYIGDSWGVYHNQATTREMKRLLEADGGNPTVLNFSRSGHTSTYALDYFEESIINNSPDTVVIEYFTNDFNSINGQDVGTYTDPSGADVDMNIATIDEYVSNIKKMIELAIDNGIQPIVVMPAVTDSTVRTQSFANFTKDLWLGQSVEKNTIDTNDLNVKSIKQSGSSTYGNRLEIIGTEEDAAARQGVVVDSDRNLTGGNIATYRNNGVVKAGVKHDGTFDVQDVQPRPYYGTHASNSSNRGLFYLFDGQGGTTKIDDELRVVIEKADGTFVTKKIQLID